MHGVRNSRSARLWHCQQVLARLHSQSGLYNTRSPSDVLSRQSIIRFLLVLLFSAAAIVSPAVTLAQPASFRVLAFYTAKGEPDHRAFAEQALTFFAELAKKDNFYFESTTQLETLNDDKLKRFQLVLWINDFPTKAEQRAA